MYLPYLVMLVGEDETIVDTDSADTDQDVAVCGHPVSDIMGAGDIAIKPLVASFHTFLQSVSDVLMHVPAGTAVQRMAVRCWSIQFQSADHPFLHHSHVFSHISSILSSADEAGAARDMVDVTDAPTSGVDVEHLTDITAQADIKTSR